MRIVPARSMINSVVRTCLDKENPDANRWMLPAPGFSNLAAPGEFVSSEQVAGLVGRVRPAGDYHGKRVLLIVPDGTRAVPVDQFFRALHAQLTPVAERIDVLIALGTHQPMSEAMICERINLGYRDPASIDVESFANREVESVLLVHKAGEMLYQLREPAA